MKANFVKSSNPYPKTIKKLEQMMGCFDVQASIIVRADLDFYILLKQNRKINDIFLII